jgi:predicted secreted Zn-dependent protease
MLPPGGTWSTVQAYGTSNTYAWDTTGLVAGTYSFQVRAENQGDSVSYESYATLNYTLTGRSGTSCGTLDIEFVGEDQSELGLIANGDDDFNVDSLDVCSAGSAMSAGFHPISSGMSVGFHPIFFAGITGATTTNYDVTGADRKAACNDIFTNSGPEIGNKRYASQTTLKYNGSWMEDTGKATATMITIKVSKLTTTLTVNLPNWTPPGTDAAKWATFMTELTKHEQGHVDLYKGAFAKWQTQVVGQTFQIAKTATDDDIDTKVEAIVDGAQAFKDAQTANTNYDAPYDKTNNPTGTDHGTENGQAALCPDI